MKIMKWKKQGKKNRYGKHSMWIIEVSEIEKGADGGETVIKQIKNKISLVWRNTWVCKLKLFTEFQAGFVECRPRYLYSGKIPELHG